MKIKHHDIIPESKEPFLHCKLGREDYANVLTKIVGSYADGFVLAINNEWGAGKTTFVKMWQQQLKNNDFQTIYFNAWENDFDSKPLVALMSELQTLAKKENEKIFKSVLAKGAVLAKEIVPSLAKSLVKSFAGGVGEAALDAVENSFKATTKILEDEIEQYTLKKKTVREFRIELEKFIKDSGSSKPLVFIIDELDRCRPDYAVEVLEQIKHFFSVSGIVFVLSIDKKHLGSAVKGYYGSENIDSDEYLRRFIDLEYSIPKPSTKNYIKYLFDYYSYQDFFFAKARLVYNEHRHDADDFVLMSEFLFTNSNATLRQQERILAHVRLTIRSFEQDEYIFPSVLLTLVYLKMFKYDIFQRISRFEFTVQELAEIIDELLSKENHLTGRIRVGFVEALILWFYNNDKEETKNSILFTKNGDGKMTSPIKSKLTNDKASLADLFAQIYSTHYASFKLSILLKRIGLFEPLKMQ